MAPYFFCLFALRAYGSPPHGTIPYFLLRARVMEMDVKERNAFRSRAYGSPAIMAPYIFFAFLRCAHMGVPRSWYPKIFVARTGGGGCKRKRNAFRSCAIWGSFTQLNKRVLYYLLVGQGQHSVPMTPSLKVLIKPPICIFMQI